MGANPESFVAGVRAHEGYGTTGHNGHFSAAYDAVADPANDPMVYFDRKVGQNSISYSSFLVEVRRGFYDRAGAADRATLDISDGGTIVTGNFTGTYYGWVPEDGQFVFSHTTH
jgi:hypothetical protein